MAKKGRRRERIRAPESEYRDEHGSLLVLRGALTPATRRSTPRSRAATSSRARTPGSAPSSSCSSASRCAGRSPGTEPITRQKELLARFRFASAEERRWIRETLRAHLAEHFPDMEAP